jgi:hypothetical protein
LIARSEIFKDARKGIHHILIGIKTMGLFTIPGTSMSVRQEILDAFHEKFGTRFDATGALKWAFFDVFLAGFHAGEDSFDKKHQPADINPPCEGEIP